MLEILIIVVGFLIFQLIRYIKALKEIAKEMGESSIVGISSFLTQISNIENGVTKGEIIVEKYNDVYKVFVRNRYREISFLIYDSKTEEVFIDREKKNRIIPITMNDGSEVVPSVLVIQKGLLDMIKKLIEKHTEKLNRHSEINHAP